MFVLSQSTQIRPFIIAESRNRNIERKKTENKKNAKIGLIANFRIDGKHFFRKMKEIRIKKGRKNKIQSNLVITDTRGHANKVLNKDITNSNVSRSLYQ